MGDWNMEWGDLALRLVRAFGALAGAAAGIAALLTDGAFEKRRQAASGWWKDFPFARYRVTRWGGTLLAVILIAPMIQFVGDWVKDDNDDEKLKDTAAGIRHDVDRNVVRTTELARQSIVDQVSKVASDADRILTDVHRSLFPIRDIRLSVELSVSNTPVIFGQFGDDFHTEMLKELEQLKRADELQKDDPNKIYITYSSTSYLLADGTKEDIDQTVLSNNFGDKIKHFNDIFVQYYFYIFADGRQELPFQTRLDFSRHADLVVFAGTDSFPPDWTKFQTSDYYETAQKKLYKWIYYPTTRMLGSTGNLNSILDLAGATICFSMWPAPFSDPGGDLQFDMAPENFTIMIGASKGISIERSRLQFMKLKDMPPFYISCALLTNDDIKKAVPPLTGKSSALKQ
jgi:hypothetical protein